VSFFHIFGFLTCFYPILLFSTRVAELCMSENCFQFYKSSKNDLWNIEMLGNALSTFVGILFMRYVDDVICKSAQRQNRRSASSLSFMSKKIYFNSLFMVKKIKSMLPTMKIQNGAQINDGHKKTFH
jgi:hypothetical protein